jgi:hypothetical protein
MEVVMVGEVMEQIFLLLDLPDVANVQLCCKRFRDITESESFWKAVVDRNPRRHLFPVSLKPSHYSFKDWCWHLNSQEIGFRVMYQALFDFDSVDGGDLSITVGDFLVLAEETPGDDGWYCCYNIRSSLVGLVPGEYVEQLPKEEFLPVSDDLLVRAPLECFLHSKNIYIQAPWVKGNLEKCISTPLHTNEALQQLKIH